MSELAQPKQPQSFEDCFKVLDEILQDKSSFKTTLEDNVLAMSHFSLGMWLRNNWYLWWSPILAKQNEEKGYPQTMPPIVKYFHDNWDITHADDMSSIIIRSYHRYLNQKDLKIEEQVKRYKAHWAKLKNNDEEE